MDHIDKFVHTSMDGHKNCFKNVLNKVVDRHTICLFVHHHLVDIFFGWVFKKFNNNNNCLRVSNHTLCHYVPFCYNLDELLLLL